MINFPPGNPEIGISPNSGGCHNSKTPLSAAEFYIEKRGWSTDFAKQNQWTNRAFQ
jgi:hypothetical protein